MNNFFALYKAELRKILAKRSVWVALALGLAFVGLVGLTNLSADGHLTYVRDQAKTLSPLSGQPLDEAFLQSFQQEIEAELSGHPERYEKMMAYDPGASTQNGAQAVGKQALYDLLYNVVRNREKVGTVTEAEFYQSMRENILHDGRELGCTEEELQTWLSIYDGIEKPIVYTYAHAYLNILDVMFLIGWLLFLNIAVAMAGVFADETAHRTDAMILSAKNGRLPVCLAKMLAGITVALGQAAVLLGVGIGLMVFFYGGQGWNAPIQNVIPSSPWNITVGTMILLYFGLAALSSALFALTNMAVSYFTRSSTATMAIHAALLFVGLFNVPPKLGLLSKLWQLRPTMTLYYGTFCNTFRYGPFNNVQVSLLLYGLCILALAAILPLCYRKAQVESR